MRRRRRTTRRRGGLASFFLGEPITSGVRQRSGSRRRRGKGVSFEVKSHVAREIFAVLYLALSLLLVLSVYGKLGAVGETFSAFLRPIFGVGIHLIPVTFFGVSLALFFSKSVVFGLSRITGIILLFVSLLSVFHLSVGVEVLFDAAQQGQFGGYVGFVTNFLFREILKIGNLGATIIFVATLLVGLLLTFQFSLVEFLKEVKPRIELRRRRFEMTEDGAVAVDEEDVGMSDEEAEINIIKPERTVDEDEEESDDALEEMLEEPQKADFRVQAVSAQGPSAQSDDEEMSAAAHQMYANWEFPPLDLLDNASHAADVDDEILKENAELIRDKLAQFGIFVVMADVHVGPTVIQYTLKPDEGVKLSKITGLKNDLALALAAPSIRIEAPIPGKSLVGIEVPNEERTIVRLRELLESEESKSIESKLRLPLGRDVSGKPRVVDLVAMPHLLIAGATGAGKSVGINSFLLALLYQNSPLDLKFIMIDPKRVELNSYNAIPHLLTPVITDVEKAAVALRWAVTEMNRRYQIFADTKHRNIVDYNADLNVLEKMPRIIVLVDELADLMMAAGKEVEASICRIAQMARAVGMHLIVATQRPSVNVITGLIKANMPSRIAYAVTSGIDSRTILDGIGAEDLLGRGDMLYIGSEMSKPVRIQGVYVSPKEVERVTNRIKLTIEPDYNEGITSPDVAAQRVTGLPDSKMAKSMGGAGGGGHDALYDQALKVIVESRKASASLLQRRLEIGYARAARILDEMEERGVIGPVRGAKAREIYVEQTS